MFAQTKHIGIWGQYADTTSSYPGEYWRVCAALDGGTYDWVKHDYWDYTAINAESLNQIDVFIVPELERGYSYDSTTGVILGPILRPWVESGGLLIGFFLQGAGFITGAGFDPISGIYISTMSGSINIIMPTHPMAEGVVSSFTGMNASYAYPNYTGYTAVATYPSGSSEYLSAGFKEIGAGCVVFFGWDYFATPTPNEDLLLQNTVTLWGARSEGPVLRSFTPVEGNIVTGYPNIRMEFQDEDGIDITSLQFYLNGAMFTGYDPIVTAIGDTVFIDIPDTMSDGEVTFRIRNIEDSAGHEGPDTVHVFSFYIDNTPPELGYHEPEGVMTYIPDGALIKYSDEISGTSAENWYIFVEGIDTIKNGTSGVITEGDTLILLAFFLASVIPTPDDTNWIEFGVWDTPDDGEPNIEVFRWWYLPTVGIGEVLPDEIEFAVWPNPFNSACRITAPEGATVEIFDIDGRSVAAFQNTDNIWQPDASTTSGVYLVRARFGGESVSKRIVYLK